MVNIKKAPRVDKRKNVWKVAEVLAENPNKTDREIAKEAEIWLWTAHRARKELEQSGTKDENITYIVGAAKQRISKISKLLDRYVNEVDAKKELERGDVSLVKDIAKDDQARVTVFGGDITDEKWGLKIIDEFDLLP